jgi:hypothetical protein
MNSSCQKICYTDLSRYVLFDVSKIYCLIKNARTVKNIMIKARDCDCDCECEWECDYQYTWAHRY